MPLSSREQACWTAKPGADAHNKCLAGETAAAIAKMLHSVCTGRLCFPNDEVQRADALLQTEVQLLASHFVV